MGVAASQAASGTGLRFLAADDAGERQAWDRTVAALPGGTVFHTTSWMDAVRRGLGLWPRFAYLAGPDGEVRALVPLFQVGGWFRGVRWLNVPQSVSAEPLAGSAAEANALLEAVTSAAAARGVRAVVLRAASEVQPTLPAAWEARREAPVLRHRLSLVEARDVETLPQARYNHRQSFRTLRRKMLHQGVRMRPVGRHEASSYTRLVHECLLRNFGHLGYPARFFHALLEYLPEHARLTVVQPEAGPPLGFALCIHSPPCCYLLHLGGRASREGKDAARFAMGESIEAAIRAGLDVFDMGETGPRQSGLIFYKEGWGAQSEDGSYLVLCRRRTPSGLRVPGESHPWAMPVMSRVPVRLAMWLAGPIHRSLQ